METNIHSRIEELFKELSNGEKEEIEETLETYLHGSCLAFALAYKEMFGGELKACYTNSEGYLIHAWIYLEGIHLDASGKISNLDDYLMKEFGDEVIGQLLGTKVPSMSAT